MLELGADDGDVAVLDAGGLELGLGLIDVGLSGDAAFEAVGGDAEGLFVVLDGVVEEFFLGVGGAGFEVVDGELGLEAEHGGLEIAGGGLGLFAGGADAAADAAPEIDLVVELDGEDDVAGAVVVDGVDRIDVGSGVGLAQAAGGGSGGDGGGEVGAVELDLGAGFAEACLGGLEVLIGGGDLRLKGVQFGIVEDGPPVAAESGIGWFGRLPGAVFFEGFGGILLEGGSHGGGGLGVFGADHASGEEQDAEAGTGWEARGHSAPAGAGFGGLGYVDLLAGGKGVGGVEDDGVGGGEAGGDFDGGAGVFADGDVDELDVVWRGLRRPAGPRRGRGGCWRGA